MTTSRLVGIGSPTRKIDLYNSLPVDHRAGFEVRNLLGRLRACRGRYVLTGQQQSTDGSATQDATLAAHNGGRYAAIRGWDTPLGGLTAGNATGHLATMISDWRTYRIIPTISQHWTPGQSGEINPGDSAISTAVDIDACLSSTPSTLRTRYTTWRQNLADDVAVLEAAGVPVLLRPWHEAGGTWFWWSKGTAAQYVQLWRDLFTYVTITRGIHNVVWVWTVGDIGYSTDWYPGNDVVDVIGHDRYNVTSGDYAAAYTDLVRHGHPRKLRAMSELGWIPVDAAAFATLGFSWCLTWTGSFITQNSDANLAAFYANAATVTRANVHTLLAGRL